MQRSKKRKILVDEMKARFDDAVRKREEFLEKTRWIRERMRDIFDAPKETITDFWCDTCQKDVSGIGFRQVCTARSWAPTAWYVSFCPKGHKIIRRITDKESDPYYDQSLLVRKLRWDMRDALLTPDDPRFKEVYPEQWEKLKNEQDKGDKN